MTGLVTTLAILVRIHISRIAAAAGDLPTLIGMTIMTLMVRGMTTIMSFEISSSRLRDERRLVSRQELISVAIEVLQLVYEHLAVTSDEALSPDLLHLWAHYRKSSIVNGYTNKFKLVEYCKRIGESIDPNFLRIDPFVISTT